MRSICLNFEINHIEYLSNQNKGEIDSESIALSNMVANSHFSNVNKALSDISSEFGSLFKYSISISKDSIAFYKKHIPWFITEIKELNNRSVSFPLCVSSLSNISSYSKFNGEYYDHKLFIKETFDNDTTDVLFAANLFTKDLYDKVSKSKIKAIWINSHTDNDSINKLINIDDVQGVELLQSDIELRTMFIDSKFSLSDIIDKLNNKPSDTQIVNLSFNYFDFVDNNSLLQKIKDFPEQLMSDSNFTFSSLNEIINYANSEYIPKFIDGIADNVSQIQDINPDAVQLFMNYEAIIEDINKCKEIEKSIAWNYLNSTNLVSLVLNKVFDKHYFNDNCSFKSHKAFYNNVDGIYANLISDLDFCLDNDNLKNSQYRFTDLEKMPKIMLKKLFSGLDSKTIYYSIQNQSLMLQDKVLSIIPYRVLDDIEEIMANSDSIDKIEIRNARRRILSKLKKM